VAERAVSTAPGQTPMGHLLNSARATYNAVPARTVVPDVPKVNVTFRPRAVAQQRLTMENESLSWEADGMGEDLHC
jgi:hypothetical protein